MRPRVDFAPLPVLCCASRRASLVFVATRPEAIDDGFAAHITALDLSHRIVPGFSMLMKVRPELVVENAFDALHFSPVHQVVETPQMRVVQSEHGFTAEGKFLLPASQWQSGDRENVAVPFRATAFGPTIVVSSLGGARPYEVITGAHGRPSGTNVTISVALPRGMPVPDNDVQYLLRQMKSGLEQDQLIWANIDESVFAPLPADDTIIALRAYMEKFARA